MTQDSTSQPRKPNARSAAVTAGPNRAAARSYLRAAGMTDADFEKPMIGIVNTWSSVTPCNMHLDRLAKDVRAGIIAAGGYPVDFNTIVVTDGISMGTAGMKASLISREVVADSIELAIEGHQLDGVVCIVGCDKTIPAAAMALARMDIPGLVYYGGTIMPGVIGDREVSVQEVFEAIGAHAAGRLDDAGLKAVESAVCPGAGACGGQFTANTMAMALSVMGISPMGANDVPAVAIVGYTNAGKSSLLNRLTDAAGPDWDYPPDGQTGVHRVVIEGDPRVELNTHVSHPVLDSTDAGCISTAARVVNAIDWICAAPSGLISVEDIPLTATIRGLMW